MNRYKVCVYAICKNEEQFVDRWMDSMGEADLVVVTDTGSTDATISRLRARNAIVYEETIKPWRFDVARNISLSYVPEDVDICVCTDLDEIFTEGWRKKLEEAWSKVFEVNKDVALQGSYLYNWSVTKEGKPGVQFTYSKIHQRHDIQWNFPVHEWIQYTGKLNVQKVFIDGMVLNHYPDHSKSRSSYLPLLKMAVEESPQDDRMMYYLGREYMYDQQWEHSIETLQKYLKLPSATWDEERSAAMRWIAHGYMKKGNDGLARKWYHKAIGEAPHMRDAYIEFAKMLYEKKEWIGVYYLITEALKIESRSTTFINSQHSWDYTPYDLGAIACYYLTLYEESLIYAQKALEQSPEDKRLQNNYQLIENKINE